MTEREKVIMGLKCLITNDVPCHECLYAEKDDYCTKNIASDALVLLEEQSKQKKHHIYLGRDDEFVMEKLYARICETLLEEGNLVITRTDGHKVVKFMWKLSEGGNAE